MLTRGYFSDRHTFARERASEARRASPYSRGTSTENGREGGRTPTRSPFSLPPLEAVSKSKSPYPSIEARSSRLRRADSDEQIQTSRFRRRRGRGPADNTNEAPPTDTNEESTMLPRRTGRNTRGAAIFPCRARHPSVRRCIRDAADASHAFGLALANWVRYGNRQFSTSPLARNRKP